MGYSIKSDITVDNQGSILIFTPTSAEGRQWMKKNLQVEDWQKRNGSVVVEHRYAPDIIHGAKADGLMVTPETE